MTRVLGAVELCVVEIELVEESEFELTDEEDDTNVVSESEGYDDAAVEGGVEVRDVVLLDENVETVEFDEDFSWIAT